MFVVKIVSDLQQVIEVCGKGCQLTIFTTNINHLLQVTDKLYHKHQ
jgi:hypothetical protein